MISWDFAGQFRPYVMLAPGTYRGGCHLTGQPVGAHAVTIVGQQTADKEESCTLSQAEQVVVRAMSNEAIFFFQDLAIGILRCLTLEGAEAVGVQCRQTPASDVAFVKFGGQQALSIGIAANEGCGLNLGGIIWIGNDMSSLLNANLQSRLTVAASIMAVKQVTIDYIARSYQMSILELRPNSSVSGGPFVTKGSLVWRGGAIVTQGQELPGGISQADPNAPGTIY